MSLKTVGWGVVLFGMVSGSGFAAEPLMPGTAGETLNGQRMVLADAVRGHRAVIVAGFSREAGNESGPWVKAIHADAAMAGVPVYTMAMLEGAPGFIRGMIKSGMKKGVPAADQGNFVVMTQDEKAWREYFGVASDKDAYVVLLDGSGKVIWRGHGAAELEPELRGK
jgi:hypothetical protein